MADAAVRSFSLVPTKATTQSTATTRKPDSGFRADASLVQRATSRASRFEALFAHGVTRDETSKSRRGAETRPKAGIDGLKVEGVTAGESPGLTTPPLQRQEAVTLSTDDVVRGLPGTKPEPALVRWMPDEHQGDVALHAPGRAALNTSRVSSSAYPRDGGSPSCSAKEGDHHAPTPPKAGPLQQASGGLNIQPISLRAARFGHAGKDSTTVEQSQWSLDIAPEALKRDGDTVPPSARCRGARASGRRRPAGGPSSLVRPTDGEAPVAQPGSAPRSDVGEVARSNRASGSTPGTVRAVSAIANSVRCHVGAERLANASASYGRQVRSPADAGSPQAHLARVGLVSSDETSMSRRAPLRRAA